MNEKIITYKDSGVDTELGQKFVQNISKLVESTFHSNVLTGLGGFAALYDISFLKNYKNPVLVSSTDGVGTKLELARLLDKHDTIGMDLVAMCVNDIIVMGAKPLFFLDYISCGKLNLQKMEQIIYGIVEGLKIAGASLVGGETAEHPGVMKEDEYDLAGFVVGVLEKDKIINGNSIQVNDIIIGLESSGPHSNGFSLIRKLFLESGKLPTDKEKLNILKEFAMKPTIIYVPYITKLLENEIPIKGMVHITGGGFYENIPRILPRGLGVEIESNKLPKLEFFEYLKKNFPLDSKTLFSTFNMGIGYMLIINKEYQNQIHDILNPLGIQSHVIGKVVAKEGVNIF